MSTDPRDEEWEKLKGRLQATWGMAAPRGLDRAAGSRELLDGELHELFAMTREQAAKAVADLEEHPRP